MEQNNKTNGNEKIDTLYKKSITRYSKDKYDEENILVNTTERTCGEVIRNKVKSIKSKENSCIYEPYIDKYNKMKNKALKEKISRRSNKDNSILSLSIMNENNNKEEDSNDEIKENVYLYQKFGNDILLKKDDYLKYSKYGNIYSTTPKKKIEKKKLNKNFSFKNKIEIDFKQSFKQDFDNVYVREKIRKNQKNNKIDTLRKNLYTKSLSELRSTPDLSDQSKKIVSEVMIDRKPLHERLHDVVNLRNLKKEEYKKALSIEESKYCSKTYDHESLNAWLEKEKQWLSNKNEKIEKIKECDVIEKENNIKEEIYNIPKINQLSRDIASVKSQNQPFFEKLYSENFKKVIRAKERLDKSIPSFKPLINKRPGYLSKSLIEYKPQDKSSTSPIKCINNQSLRNYPSNATISPKKVLRISSRENFFILPLDYDLRSVDGKHCNLNNTDELYKLNVRVNSAWSNECFNSVYGNKNNKGIIKTLLLNK